MGRRKEELFKGFLLAFLLALGAFAFSTGAVESADKGYVLDVYTQKGGHGLNASGGIFSPLEIVFLYANLTYNGWPVKNVLVDFEVNNSLNTPILVVTKPTNCEGVASFYFRVPPAFVVGTNGTWTVTASAEIAGERVTDTATFEVDPELIVSITVGLKTREGETVWSVDVSQIREDAFRLVIPQELFELVTEFYGNQTVFLTPFELNMNLTYDLYMESQPQKIGILLQLMNPGDIDNNNVVNMEDLGQAGAAFGATPQSSRYNLFVDVRFDFRINMRDIARIAMNYGKTY